MRPDNVPVYAIPIPPGGLQPQEQILAIHSIQSQVAAIDTLNLNNFNHACADWLTYAGRDRDMNLTVPPKPEQPISNNVKTADDTDNNGIIWLWLEPGAPLGVLCPDLPPLPVPPGANHVHIVARIGLTNWFSAGQDDTYPALPYPQVGNPPVTTISDDKVSGTFIKYSAAMGRGWYVLQ